MHRGPEEEIKQKLRVVYVFDTTLDVRFVEGFSEIFDLILVSPAGAAFTNAPEGRFRHVKLPVGRLGFVSKSARWLAANSASYDLVFGLDTLTAALACNLAKFLTRKPLILVLLRPAVEYYRCRRLRGARGFRYWPGLAVVRFLTWFNCRRATAVGPCSHHIAKQVKCRRTEVIPSYGVDVSAYTAPLSRTEARAELNLPGNVPIAFCRSRIGVEKDPETFLKAIKGLQEAGVAVEALYVGGEFREFLTLAASIGVKVHARDHVHPLQELPKYYVAADVAVQTSLSEGLGLSPLESACCGVPVVVSATGGLLETIRDYETGLTAPVGDAEAVSAAIRWMIEHPREGRNMAEATRRLVELKYSSAVAFECWMLLAEEIVDQQRRTHRRDSAA